MDKQTNDKVSFISFIIPEFALAYKIDVQQAYFYLKQYGGIDYLNPSLVGFAHRYVLLGCAFHVSDLS